jgi:hypothetical protein
MLADAEKNRLYTAYFGKLPLRVWLYSSPRKLRQAWPTLVYMPFTAFMDSTQRYMASGGNMRAATDTFFVVAPHECPSVVGIMVGWKSYRDQWSEGCRIWRRFISNDFARRNMHMSSGMINGTGLFWRGP